MPKRTDIHKILIIGAGPIVIGQACEFDYSGTQACKALREEGFEVVLVNSNPATIMTDPEMADRTYIEPITPEVVEQILAVEKPDAVLPTLGGQTGLNVGLALYENGALDRHGCILIGASADAIRKAEDRELFKRCMEEIGLESARSALAHSLDEARRIRDEVGLPCVLRPSFTLGGSGGGIAYNREEFDRMVATALELSPVHSVLVEESVIGWKEYEMEVMRDGADNAVIVCSIENFDPMGVHTGDSITVAPAQTLTDKEYQRMRDASLAILRKIGVETGGSNVQFAVDPAHRADDRHRDEPAGQPLQRPGQQGDRVPDRQDRRQARRRLPARRDPERHHPRDARLLRADDRLRRDQDPALGVREVPRGRPGADDADEVGRRGHGDRPDVQGVAAEGPARAGGRPVRPGLRQEGPLGHAAAAQRGRDQGEAGHAQRRARLVDPPRPARGPLRRADPRADRDRPLVPGEHRRAGRAGGPAPRRCTSLEEAGDALLREAKQNGFSDRQLATLWDTTEAEVRRDRQRRGIGAVFKLVDTCAAEFEAVTPYYYSTYEREDEARDRRASRGW